jgi:hypothetical protein
MLNLLIAVISDTFDKVQDKKQSSDCKERCNLMIEIEEIIQFFRTKEDIEKEEKKYIHICRYQSISDGGDDNDSS